MSRKDPTPSVQAARDEGESSDGRAGGGGASPTAVLLAFLDVSLLARGRAEGYRGRGLTVTWVGRVEGGDAADEGNGIIDMAADLGRLAGGPGSGRHASFSR